MTRDHTRLDRIIDGIFPFTIPAESTLHFPGGSALADQLYELPKILRPKERPTIRYHQEGVCHRQARPRRRYGANTAVRIGEQHPFSVPILPPRDQDAARATAGMEGMNDVELFDFVVATMCS
jgi:hypothetical protein